MDSKIVVITCMEDSKAARSLAEKLHGKGKRTGEIILLTEQEYTVLTKKTTYIQLQQSESLQEDKVKFLSKTINDEYIRITYNVDDITIRIPTVYKSKNVFLFYTDE